jgi:hypothetical protein
MSIKLEQLERRVMEMLLAGNDPILNILRDQYSVARVVKHELTGVGFFVTFAVPPEAARLDGEKSLHFGDVKAEIDGLQHGAGFVLHVRDGAIDYLEGYSYDEPWPASLEHFRLMYIEGDERDLTVLWKKWASMPAP